MSILNRANQVMSSHMPELESFERIRVFMLSKWLLDTDDCTVIAFTSRSPGEGVSTVVAGLAAAFSVASPEDILVVEIEPGKKTIADMLSSEKSVEDSDLAAYIMHDEVLGIDVVSMSDELSKGGNTAKQARAALEKFRSRYKVVLIDAGALSNCKSTYWLTNSNYRVLVIDSTVTTTEMLEYKRKELENSSILLDGSILNKRVYPIPGWLYWLSR